MVSSVPSWRMVWVAMTPRSGGNGHSPIMPMICSPMAAGGSILTSFFLSLNLHHVAHRLSARISMGSVTIETAGTRTSSPFDSFSLIRQMRTRSWPR